MAFVACKKGETHLHSIHHKILLRVEICDLLGFPETSVNIYHYRQRDNPGKEFPLQA
jgi:hypothetical protein